MVTGSAPLLTESLLNLQDHFRFIRHHEVTSGSDVKIGGAEEHMKKEIGWALFGAFLVAGAVSATELRAQVDEQPSDLSLTEDAEDLGLPLDNDVYGEDYRQGVCESVLHQVHDDTNALLNYTMTIDNWSSDGMAQVTDEEKGIIQMLYQAIEDRKNQYETMCGN